MIGYCRVDKSKRYMQVAGVTIHCSCRSIYGSLRIWVPERDRKKACVVTARYTIRPGCIRPFIYHIAEPDLADFCEKYILALIAPK